MYDLACLNIAKKWRLFKEERGIVVPDPGDRLEEALKSLLGISAKVHLLEPNSIERSTGKAVRVIDKRKLID